MIHDELPIVEHSYANAALARQLSSIDGVGAGEARFYAVTGLARKITSAMGRRCNTQMYCLPLAV